MSASNNIKCSYIKYDRKISIIFDGKKYSAFKGDTIASALLRNNVQLIARSFKYHRPRGIYTCGIEEPNGIVQAGHLQLRVFQLWIYPQQIQHLLHFSLHA